ncbi:helicase conserved C-terminal domain-containing protein [Neospora caninum Liverpool]|uniref:ATP-dependent RNA helicase n=1 Tax=Neospora caninum (strain Liverpool) TaxID=572307 RepID=F0VJW6_NEOCL|nr:helicase conserved C-terminal domain-containing protein [Neospora caninum Liverpool]CBZ54028.1 helicase conserved C-terminal domain-containing protein [Neospora caninum Liverpool]CEL68032.1 TPA: helicase conserved C-terminal domain-containing protein, putative [Neospora caninum Liverpool]|eukprot:XP_003884059.1 helicase conserved C-terminal domain-containing protein [Neospora caninum Liverpool]
MAQRGTANFPDPSRELPHLTNNAWSAAQSLLLRPLPIRSACVRGRHSRRHLSLLPSGPSWAHSGSGASLPLLSSPPWTASSLSPALASSSPVQVCAASRSWVAEAGRCTHSRHNGARRLHFSRPFCLQSWTRFFSQPKTGESSETLGGLRHSRTIFSCGLSLHTRQTYGAASSEPASASGPLCASPSPFCLPPSPPYPCASASRGRRSLRARGDSEAAPVAAQGGRPSLLPMFFSPGCFSPFHSAAVSPSCDPARPPSSPPSPCLFAATRDESTGMRGSASSPSSSPPPRPTAAPPAGASCPFLPALLAPPFIHSLSPLASRWVACLSPFLQALPPPRLRLWGGSCCELEPLLLPPPLPLSVLFPHPLPPSVLSSPLLPSTSLSPQSASLLPPSVAAALHRCFRASAISPLQQFLLPLLLSPSHDLFVLSRMHSGKSLAVHLAVVLRLLEGDKRANANAVEREARPHATQNPQETLEKGKETAFPQCIFLLPTRDTATQTHAELLALLRYTPQLRVALLSGETAFYQAQQEAGEERGAGKRERRAVSDVDGGEDRQEAECADEPGGVSRRGCSVRVFRRIEKLRAHIWICTPGKLDEYLGYISWKDSLRRATTRLTPTGDKAEAAADERRAKTDETEDTQEGGDGCLGRCSLLVVDDAAALLQQSERGRQATAALLRLKERLPPGEKGAERGSEAVVPRSNAISYFLVPLLNFFGLILSHQTIFLSSWLSPDLRSVFVRLARVRSLTINALVTPAVASFAPAYSNASTAQASHPTPRSPPLSVGSRSAPLRAMDASALPSSPSSTPLPACSASCLSSPSSTSSCSRFPSPPPSPGLLRDADTEEARRRSRQTPEASENETEDKAALLKPSPSVPQVRETVHALPRRHSLRESILNVEETVGLWGPKRAAEFLAKKKRQWSELQRHLSGLRRNEEEPREERGNEEERDEATGIHGETLRSEFAIYPADLHAHVLFNVLMNEANRAAELETKRRGLHRGDDGRMERNEHECGAFSGSREKPHRIIVFFSCLKSLQFHYVYFKHYVFPTLLTSKTADPVAVSTLSAFPSFSPSVCSLSSTYSSASFPFSSRPSTLPAPPSIPARLPTLLALHHGLSGERRRAVVEAFSSPSVRASRAPPKGPSLPVSSAPSPCAVSFSSSSPSSAPSPSGYPAVSAPSPLAPQAPPSVGDSFPLPDSEPGRLTSRSRIASAGEREPRILHGHEPPQSANPNCEVRVLFATDLAATGVNVGDVDFIVHVGMARDPELLVQRLTRVARPRDPFFGPFTGSSTPLSPTSVASSATSSCASSRVTSPATCFSSGAFPASPPSEMFRDVPGTASAGRREQEGVVGQVADNGKLFPWDPIENGIGRSLLLLHDLETHFLFECFSEGINLTELHPRSALSLLSPNRALIAILGQKGDNEIRPEASEEGEEDEEHSPRGRRVEAACTRKTTVAETENIASYSCHSLKEASQEEPETKGQRKKASTRTEESEEVEDVEKTACADYPTPVSQTPLSVWPSGAWWHEVPSLRASADLFYRSLLGFYAMQSKRLKFDK